MRVGINSFEKSAGQDPIVYELLGEIDEQKTSFSSRIYVFSLFHEILQLEKFQGADSKYDNNIFKSQSQYMQIWHF